jgi:hypothetical protein
LEAFDKLIPHREHLTERDHRLKTLYSYDVRDSEMYRYLFKVEQKVNEMISKTQVTTS